jgi:hypothetical protein
MVMGEAIGGFQQKIFLPLAYISIKHPKPVKCIQAILAQGVMFHDGCNTCLKHSPAWRPKNIPQDDIL